MAEERRSPETLRDQARESVDEELVEDLEAPAESAQRVAGGGKKSSLACCEGSSTSPPK